MNRGSLAARLLAAFLEDLDEQVRAMDADLIALEGRPADEERLKSLFRAAHTIKGAARAANLPPVEEACHVLEGRLADARDGRTALGPAQFRALFAAVDALREAGERLRAGEPLDGAQVGGLPELLRERWDSPPAPPPEPGPAPAPPPSAERGDARLRVEAEKLDALLASASQLVIARGRVAARPPEVRALRDLCARVEAQHRRAARSVRAALESVGAPPAVADALAAVEADLQRAAREAARIASAVVGDARAVEHAADELAGRVRGLRLRPFADACEALPRVLRDVAAGSGKEARLVVQGGGVEADRVVIEGVREALLHLVRNAVDHGIEPPDAREAAGKPPAGTVTVAAAVHSDRMTVTVADDGRGLDLPAIREALERRGLSVPSDERELARAVFTGGLST
ncbi:MAG TPA: Hpt domain-containing protein, partial [Longimicrobiaceae bacterium]